MIKQVAINRDEALEFCTGCEHSKTIDADLIQPMECSCPSDFEPVDNGCPRKKEFVDMIVDCIIDNSDIIKIKD